MWYNGIMAAFITHELLAQAVYNELDREEKEKIPYLYAFFIGAQGGDCFFTYRPLSGKKRNLGKLLHRKNIFAFFAAAKEYAEKTGDYSYIFGYITHYVADTVFHPFVYATEYRLLSSLKKQRRKDKVHFLIERDIDSLLLKKAGVRPLFKAEEKDFAAAYALLKYAVKKAYGQELNERAALNAMKRFPARQRFFDDPDGTRRKKIYAWEKKLHLRHFFSYMFLRPDPDIRFETLSLGEEKKTVYQLFEEAKEKSLRLIRAFCRQNTLNESEFSQDFNIGKR